MSRNQRLKQDYNTLNDELFHDQEFPPCDKSLYGDDSLSLRTRQSEGIVWKRPGEIVIKPEFIVEGAKHHDLDQGALGNCWFIAGAAVLASSHPAEFQKVVPPDQSFHRHVYTGMFRFNFWWYGEWTEIKVDDYLPTDGYKPIYCRNRERQNEFWPCLLEKAYAKLHGSYASLNGGYIQDAMVDLTGGISEVIEIQNKDRIPADLYNLLLTSYKMNTLMGASIHKKAVSHRYEELPCGLLTKHAYSVTGLSKKKAVSQRNEGELSNGLLTKHAYSITGFSQIPYGREEVNLLRLRNPWGREEWNGPWSDGSPEMARISRDLKNYLQFQCKDDGEFWMCYADFIEQFDSIQLCHLEPDALIQELERNKIKQQWKVTVYHGAWIKGITAGGNGDDPRDNSFWKNPQYYFVLDKVDSTLGGGNKCTLIVSLLRKESIKSKICIGFKIFKMKYPDMRPLDSYSVSERARLLEVNFEECHFYRDVTKRYELTKGTYVIIPFTPTPYEEGYFMLRIFTEKRISHMLLNRAAKTPTGNEKLLGVSKKNDWKMYPN